MVSGHKSESFSVLLITASKSFTTSLTVNIRNRKALVSNVEGTSKVLGTSSIAEFGEIEVSFIEVLSKQKKTKTWKWRGRPDFNVVYQVNHRLVTKKMHAGLEDSWACKNEMRRKKSTEIECFR